MPICFAKLASEIEYSPSYAHQVRKIGFRSELFAKMRPLTHPSGQIESNKQINTVFTTQLKRRVPKSFNLALYWILSAFSDRCLASVEHPLSAILGR